MPRTRIEPIDRADSLAQRAYASLRQAIRDGGLVHGEIYSENELGESMAISRTPVREALIELSREGLIEILPQRGFRLRELSDEEIAEVFDLRGELEEYVLGKLASQASEEDVRRLRELIDRQRDVVDDASAFLSLDEQFHLLMPRLVGLERTHGMIVNLRAVMWLVASVALSVRSRAPHVVEEHEQIVEAIAAHDVSAARRASREHLRHTRAAFLPQARRRAGDEATSAV